MKQIVLLFSIFLISCTTKEVGNKDIIVLSTKEHIGKAVEFPDLFEVCGVIELESPDECLLGYISKVVSFRSEYYLLDRVQKCLFVFDENGHYKRRIGTVGAGPGEYVHLTDFTIDKENGRVVTLDAPFNVYLYDLQGNFLVAKKLDKSMFWNLISDKNGFVCTTGYSTYVEGDKAFLIYRFDKNFNFSYKEIEVLPLQLVAPPRTSALMQEYRGKTFYIDSYRNKIYHIGENTTVTPYQIEFEEPMPYRVFSDMQDFMQSQQKYDFLMEAFVTDKEILLTYIHRGKYYAAKFDMNGKVLVNASYKGRFPTLYPSDDVEMYMYVNAPEYLSYWKDYVSLPLDGSMTEEDNGLILKCRLK